MEIRNIAIIAHVDHGKTTLVDGMLKQTHTFRDNQREMTQNLIMDSNDLEREKGITILSKNTSVFYKNTKINIIDTPGHADFGGEVERVLNMASGAILLVDASEGPLPQTRFVLKKALDAKLKIILVINKIDKKDARVPEVMRQIETLFLELAHDEDSLHFPTLYAVGRDSKAFKELPAHYSGETPGDLMPLFDTILDIVPNAAVNEDKPFQMLISTLDSDQYVGRLCVGKVTRGSLNKGSGVALVQDDKILGHYKAMKMFTSEGLIRKEVDTVVAGDIVAVAGIPELTIGQTVTDPQHPESLPTIKVEDPTLKVIIAPNSSPFAGREGTFTTSRQIRERLMKERETNLGLHIDEGEGGAKFVVSGRGELHLSILIETMRREGFEIEVSRPQVIYKTIDSVKCEPFEEVTIDVHKDFIGAVSEEMGKRKATLIDLTTDQHDNMRSIYKISSQNLLGIRNVLLTATRGTAVMNTFFLGYEPVGPRMSNERNGAIITSQTGKANSYGLGNAQERGTMFVGHGTEVYEGMVVGIANKPMDLEVNVIKGKQLTNNRSSGEGVSVQLSPATIMSLEQCLDFILDDELLEVTPVSLRIRKRHLTMVDRKRAARAAAIHA